MLKPEILNAALIGFEEQKKRMDAQIAEIRQMLAGKPNKPITTSEPPKRKGRKMSAAARKRIGDAQRKRWAESKGQSGSPSSPVTARPKRKLSAAGRKAISEAAKKRWAAKRAETEKPEPAVAKKGAVKTASVKVTVKKAAARKPQKKAAKAPSAVETATR